MPPLPPKSRRRLNQGNQTPRWRNLPSLKTVVESANRAEHAAGPGEKDHHLSGRTELSLYAGLLQTRHIARLTLQWQTPPVKRKKTAPKTGLKLSHHTESLLEMAQTFGNVILSNDIDSYFGNA